MEAGSGDRPGYDNIEFGNEAAADTNQNRFGIGKRNEGSVTGGFLRSQHCKPAPRLTGVRSQRNL